MSGAEPVKLLSQSKKGVAFSGTGELSSFITFVFITAVMFLSEPEKSRGNAADVHRVSRAVGKGACWEDAS